MERKERRSAYGKEMFYPSIKRCRGASAGRVAGHELTLLKAYIQHTESGGGDMNTDTH